MLLSDVDNTLFDFHRAERAAYAAVQARFSLPNDEKAFAVYKAINASYWKKLLRGETTSAQLRLDRFRDFTVAIGLEGADIRAMSDLYVRTLGQQCTPVAGAEEFLARVSARMPVYLVTNGFAAVQRARMQASPLRRYIADALISEEFENAKPHPEMIRTAMKRAGVADPARAVMIGDNEETDIGAAKNAGVRSVLFTNEGPPPKHTSADFIAATLKDAADWILST